MVRSKSGRRKVGIEWTHTCIYVRHRRMGFGSCGAFAPHVRKGDFLWCGMCHGTARRLSVLNVAKDSMARRVVFPVLLCGAGGPKVSSERKSIFEDTNGRTGIKKRKDGIDMDNEKYYVDAQGNLWRGYIASEDKLHYARFTGLTNGFAIGIVRPIWVLERSDPNPQWLYLCDVPIANRDRKR